MRRVATCSALVVLGMLWAAGAQAQATGQAPATSQDKAQAKATASMPSVDDIIEKHLAASGGRAALAKLGSRTATGTIAMSMQGNQIPGTVDIFLKAPNKTRTYIKMDLAQFGMGEVVVDQRCDGKIGWASNSMQGEREITGDQLQGMLNASFPTPLLNYKELGAKIELVGKEKLGDRDAYVLRYSPKAGPVSTSYFDAETFHDLRTVTKINVPEAGGEIEQTTDSEDFRDLDGVKIPYVIKIVNPMQAMTITFTKIEHNKPIDEAMFSKPAAK